MQIISRDSCLKWPGTLFSARETTTKGRYVLNLNSARFLASYGTASQLPASTLPEVSFVGRSNVGKSSLLNKLLNRKALAKVFSTPGKTTTINFFQVDDYHFVDLPGYGYAKVPNKDRDRWVELMDGYFNQDRRFALICVLVDIRHDPSKLDISMVATLIQGQFPFLIVLTKADKLSKTQQQRQWATIRKQLHCTPDQPVIITSSAKGTGIPELRSAIEAACKEA